MVLEKCRYDLINKIIPEAGVWSNKDASYREYLQEIKNRKELKQFVSPTLLDTLTFYPHSEAHTDKHAYIPLNYVNNTKKTWNLLMQKIVSGSVLGSVSDPPSCYCIPWEIAGRKYFSLFGWQIHK